MEVMGCQVHAIRKAIRPIFADLVTIIVTKKVKVYNLNDGNEAHIYLQP